MRLLSVTRISLCICIFVCLTLSLSLLSAFSCISSVSSVHVTWIWFVLLLILPEANEHLSTHGDKAWDLLDLSDKPRLNKRTNKTLSLPFSPFELIYWSQGGSFVMAGKKYTEKNMVIQFFTLKLLVNLTNNYKTHWIKIKIWTSNKTSNIIIIIVYNIFTPSLVRSEFKGSRPGQINWWFLTFIRKKHSLEII